MFGFLKPKKEEVQPPPTLPKSRPSSSTTTKASPTPPASSGGFFNLPSATTATTPVASDGDMFKGLSMKPAETTPTGESNGSSMFSGLSVVSEPVTNTDSGGGGFNFMTTITEDSSTDGPSGFNFTNEGTTEVGATEDTGFSFLSTGVEADVVPDIGFDFGVNTTIISTSESPVPPVSHTPPPSTYSMPTSDIIFKPTVYEVPQNIVVEVSKVKKKKSSKRPGWAAGGVTSTGGDDGDKDVEEEKPKQSTPAAPIVTPTEVPTISPAIKDSKIKAEELSHTPSNVVSTPPLTAVVPSAFKSPAKKEEIKPTDLPKMAKKEELKVEMPKKAEPKKEEDALLTSLHEFNKQASEITDQLHSLKSNRKAIVLQKRAEEDQLGANENSLVDLEKRQVSAVDNEDYEKAEALDAEIETVKGRIFTGRTSILSLSKQLSNLKMAKNALIEEELLLVTKTSAVLNEIQNKSSSDLSVFKKKVSQEEQDENTQITKIATRADLKSKHLLRDEENAKADREEIETKIARETGEFIIHVNEVDGNIQTLEKEVEELRALLAKKEGEIAELTTEKNEINENITNIRKNFAVELEGISATELVVQEERRAVDGMLEEVKQRTEKLAKTKDLNQHHISVSLDYINSFKNQLKIASVLQEALKGQQSFDNSTPASPANISNTSGGDIDKLITGLKEEISILQSSLRMFETQVNSIDESLNQATSDIKSIDVKLPALEAEKKTAVASKNFKDAARINKDIQSLNEERTKLLQTLEELNKNKQEASGQLEERKAKLTSSQQKLNEQQVAADRIAIDSLRGSIVKLKEAVLKIKKYGGGGNSKSPSHQMKNNFGSVSASLLDIELVDQTTELTALCQKHGLMDLAIVNVVDDTTGDEKEITRDEHDIVAETSDVLSPSENIDNLVSIDKVSVVLEGRNEGVIIQLKKSIEDLEGKLQVAMEKEEYAECESLDKEISDLKSQLEIEEMKPVLDTEDEIIHVDDSLPAEEGSPKVDDVTTTVIDGEAIKTKVSIINEDIKRLTSELETSLAAELYDKCEEIQKYIDDLQSEKSLLLEQAREGGIVIEGGDSVDQHVNESEDVAPVLLEDDDEVAPVLMQDD